MNLDLGGTWKLLFFEESKENPKTPQELTQCNCQEVKATVPGQGGEQYDLCSASFSHQCCERAAPYSGLCGKWI